MQKSFKKDLRLAFYFDSGKVSPWTWDDFVSNRVGFSGTDGQLLLLAHELSKIFTVLFISNNDPGAHPFIENIFADNLADIVFLNRQRTIDLLIFNNKGDAETARGIEEFDKNRIAFILWDQNGPSPGFENLLANSKYLKRIVCVSRNHAIFHRHKKYFDKVTYIYNGRDYARPIDNAYIQYQVAYIGALDKTKGFHHLAKAWSRIKKEFPDASLFVIGSIKTHDITRQIGSLGVASPEFENQYIKPYLGNDHTSIQEKGVFFLGHLSFQEIQNVLKTVMLGVVNLNTHMHTETFCVSAIDFQGHGIPVIGGKAGGLKETVRNGYTGILIKDSKDIAKAIINLFKNKQQFDFLKKNTCQWVNENFNRDTINKCWAELITDLVNNRKNKPLPLTLKDVTFKNILKELVRIKNSSFKKNNNN